MTTAVLNGSLSHLRAGGVSVLLDSSGGGLPAVLHWGADLGVLSETALVETASALGAPLGDSAIDVPGQGQPVADAAEGWVGTPGLIGSRHVPGLLAAFHRERRSRADGPQPGLFRCRRCGGATGADDRRRTGIRRPAPAPRRVHEYGSGRLQPGWHGAGAAGAVRSRRAVRPHRTACARTGSATRAVQGRHPAARVAEGQAGTRRVTTCSPRGWPVSASAPARCGPCTSGWSGNQVAYAERSYNGIRQLGGGELLLAGEVRLQPGRDVHDALALRVLRRRSQ